MEYIGESRYGYVSEVERNKSFFFFEFWEKMNINLLPKIKKDELIEI